MIDLYIEKAFYTRNVSVIKNFPLQAAHGEIVAVTGPSGVGKSTLLRIIAGLHKDYQGRVKINHILTISLMPQKNGLLPSMRVTDNLILLEQARGRQVDRAKAQELLVRLGLGGLARRFPHELSGGQYSRLSLGQAVFPRPDILLLDEPFSALDGDTKTGVMDVFLALARERSMTTVFVTHDEREAEYLGARIVKMVGL